MYIPVSKQGVNLRLIILIERSFEDEAWSSQEGNRHLTRDLGQAWRRALNVRGFLHLLFIRTHLKAVLFPQDTPNLPVDVTKGKARKEDYLREPIPLSSHHLQHFMESFARHTLTTDSMPRDISSTSLEFEWSCFGQRMPLERFSVDDPTLADVAPVLTSPATTDWSFDIRTVMAVEGGGVLCMTPAGTQQLVEGIPARDQSYYPGFLGMPWDSHVTVMNHILGSDAPEVTQSIVTKTVLYSSGVAPIKRLPARYAGHTTIFQEPYLWALAEGRRNYPPYFKHQYVTKKICDSLTALERDGSPLVIVRSNARTCCSTSPLVNHDVLD